MNRRAKAAARARQRGGISIEFVLLFPLFLVVFYAILSYGVSFAQLHALNGLAAEAAQATRAVVIEGDESDIRSALDKRVDAAVDRYGGVLSVRGCANGSNRYAYSASEGELTVCLEADLLLPSLTIFGLRVPDIEGPLRSRSRVRLAVLEEDET